MLQPSHRQIAKLAVVCALGFIGSAHAAVNAYVKNSVPGARCVKVDTSEASFGYPVTRLISVSEGTIASVGTVFDGAYVIWTAYGTADCSGAAIKQGPTLWAPYKPGKAVSWTFEAK